MYYMYLNTIVNSWLNLVNRLCPPSTPKRDYTTTGSNTHRDEAASSVSA